MIGYLFVAIGGAVGSISRLALSNLIARHLGDSFPWGTLLVNVSGSLLIGLLAALATLNTRLTGDARLFTTHFMMVGVCGGFTTFSAFSLQTLSLLQTKHYVAAGTNILLSTTLCLIAVAIGYSLGAFFIIEDAK